MTFFVEKNFTPRQVLLFRIFNSFITHITFITNIHTRSITNTIIEYFVYFVCTFLANMSGFLWVWVWHVLTKYIITTTVYTTIIVQMFPFLTIITSIFACCSDKSGRRGKLVSKHGVDIVTGDTTHNEELRFR